MNEDYIKFLVQSLAQQNNQSQQAINSLYGGGLNNLMGSSSLPSSQLGLLGHYQQVKEFRKEFKELSKEDFRNMSSDPKVKEIMNGKIQLTFEEKKERIKEHLKNI